MSSTSSVRVVFFPAGVAVQAQTGDTLLDVALENGLEMPHECGGNCACTTCHVHILEGGECLSPPEEVEMDRLSTADNLQPCSRLGCQAMVLRGEVVALLVEEAAW